MPDWVEDDGGRAAAGFRGYTGDCAARSIAIVTGWDYRKVYDEIIEQAKSERPRGRRQRSHPRTGVHKELLRRWLPMLGFEWTPTMSIGTGTTVHLRGKELPSGRLVVVCSRHYTAVIDSVIHDTHDPSREGTRAVYGYFTWSAS